MLRNRFKESGFTSHTVKTLDLFDKLEDKYVEQSVRGGTISLFALILTVYLIITELSYYYNSKLTFKFSPDTEMDDKLTINMDITIATSCSMLGTDMDDLTSNSLYGFSGELQEEDVWFDLDDSQRLYFESMRQINSYLREEYHAVSDLLWRSGQAAIMGSMPERSVKQNKAFDACRIHGELTLNKVAGEIWVAGGKTLILPGAKIFIGIISSDGGTLNMTHRIDKFSFGEPAPGIIHPLEGYEVVAKEPMRYDYFIEVVPTEIDTMFSKTKTYQYSLREHSRSIRHSTGPHSSSGVYFRYDIAALKLRVSQERDNIIQFTVRLFSIIGGVYIIAGMINTIISKLFSKSSTPAPI